MSSPALPLASETERPARRALTTRYADFWLLGGASVLVWAVMWTLEFFRAPDSSGLINQRFASLQGFVATCSLLVNYPHFMASYALGYSRGLKFARRHWFALLGVPLLLLLGIGAAWLVWRQGTAGDAFFAAIDGRFEALGLTPPGGRIGPPGRKVMGLLMQVMLITVGWHYAKQVYGATLVYARFDGYEITLPQRRLLRVAVLATWWASWFQLNIDTTVHEHNGVYYAGFGLPPILYWAALDVVLLSVVAIGWYVVRANRVRTGRYPGANIVIPFLSFLIWWLPPFKQPEYTAALVPLFHGLQYLPFVYRVETSALARAPAARAPWIFTGLALGIVLAGLLSFELIPGTLDLAADTPSRMGAQFFMVAALVFINVHHFFIDAVIWRLGDPQVREDLLGATSAGAAR